MAGLLLYLLIVHTADVVVAVVAAAGHYACAASVAPVVGADHRSSLAAHLEILIKEVAFGALHPDGVQISHNSQTLAQEVAAASGTVRLINQRFAGGANVLLGVGGTIDLVGLHAAAALHVEILAVLTVDAGI